MDKHIEEYLADLMPESASRGIRITSQREIAYGVQLRLERDKQTASLNVYHSLKRGLSKVWNVSRDNVLRVELDKPDVRQKQQVPEFHCWDNWIGSDECGKGDYFGALVVAAFAADSGIVGELRDLGIRDSKQLREHQIRELAKELYSSYGTRITCIVLKPLRYNEIIADMQTQAQNLNDLLAWQHGKAIQELFPANPLSQGVLVDKFSPQRKVQQLLKKAKFPLPVEERTHAESDLAVAAASIVARYQFLLSRETMEHHYQMKFPLGSGKNVLPPAQIFADKYGWQRLAEVAKLHFITSRSVQVRDIFDSNQS